MHEWRLYLLLKSINGLDLNAAVLAFDDGVVLQARSHVPDGGIQLVVKERPDALSKLWQVALRHVWEATSAGHGASSRRADDPGRSPAAVAGIWKMITKNLRGGFIKILYVPTDPFTILEPQNPSIHKEWSVGVDSKWSFLPGCNTARSHARLVKYMLIRLAHLLTALEFKILFPCFYFSVIISFFFCKISILVFVFAGA